MTPLYCLPGTQCTADLWQDLHACDQLDLALHHVPLPQANSPEAIVEQLSHRLPEKIALMGFSLGGYLAALYTVKYPHRVSRLTIISNTPCPLNHAELESRAQTLAFLAKFRYTGMTQAKAESMLDEKNRSTENVKRILTMDAELGGDTLVQQLTATTTRQDLANRLITTNVPLQFIVSERDPLVSLPWLQQLTKQYARVKTHCIAGSGHMLPIEQPEFVMQQLRTHHC